MWLKHLNVLQFKNATEITCHFSPEVNAFTGVNGAGKTNLLDAIHYLALCKSYFNPIDSQQIQTNQDWFMVQGTFEKGNQIDLISCSLKRNQKKQFKKNKKEYDRLADHIGLYPLVMISPYDSAIILDGSEERRKFMDSVLAQTDSAYLDGLIRYNKLLLQRNTLLKQTPRHIAIDAGLLEVLDMQLHDLGTFIFQKRTAFMEIFVEDFNKHYRFLSGGAEQVTLMYDSPLQERPLEEWLAMNFEKDRILERTSVGVHKDDLLFTIHEDKPLKKFGSQGQQKSFLIALKLAQYSYLYAMKGFKPILLLDDIVDRLDEFRITQLMQMVSDAGFGQIFITDTDADRINRIFDSIQKPVRLFTIQGGEVIAQTP